MTFFVERPHPNFLPPPRPLRRPSDQKPERSVQRGLLSLLPFELEVDPEPRGQYPVPCDCKTVYRVTPNGVRWLKSRQVLKKTLTSNRRPCLCPCMGHIIKAA